MSKLINPFPGLRPFGEKEEHLFFGRESQVDTMIDKLADGRFLAVVGPSGSGKSSLVNCGLRPALIRGALSEAGTSWRIAKFRPGNDPLQAMTRALARKGLLFGDFPASVSVDEVIDTQLRMSKRGLIELVRKARLPEHTNLLIIADQFEELFRYAGVANSTEESEHQEISRAFVNLLLEPHLHQSQRIYVVLTMRSDFLGDCATFEGLPEAINQGQYLVPRMTRSERRAAIEGPVHVAGAQIEPVLLTRLVNDVGDNPDQLSILQHALNRTWAKWATGNTDVPIGLADYEGIGTMAHALDNHANEAYKELKDDKQRQLAGRIFKALTDKGSDVRGIRRPTRFAELCKIVDGEAEIIKEVIEVFRHPSRSFLMPPAPDPIDDDTIIDISHESLMRVWTRLNVWSREEAEDAERYRRLAQNADLFKKGEVDPMGGAELKGTREWWGSIQPNMAWACRYHKGYDAAKQFLDVSQESELKGFQRRKRLVTAAWAFTVIAFVAGAYLWEAQQARVESEQARDEAEQARIASEKKRELLASAVQQFSEAKLREWENIAGADSRRNNPDLERLGMRTNAAAAIAAVVAADGIGVPIDSISNDDLFEFSNIEITDSSDLDSSDLDSTGSPNPALERMFGNFASVFSDQRGHNLKGPDQLRESESYMFPDSYSDPEHFVKWRLQEPRKLKSVRLFAIHDWSEDRRTIYRAIDNFQLFIMNGGWKEIVNYSPSRPYGGNAPWASDRGTSTALSVCFDLEVVGQEFKAVFRQAGSGGPRIIEVDGKTEECSPVREDEQFNMWTEHAKDNQIFQRLTKPEQDQALREQQLPRDQ